MDEAQQHPSPRRRRGWIVVVLVLVSGIFAAAAALWASVRAEAWAKATATAALRAPVDFAVETLRGDRVALRDVTLGPADAPWATAAAVTARFTAARLGAARLDAVEIVDLRIDLAALPSTGAPIGADHDVLDAWDSVLSFDPPVDAVAIDGAEIRLRDRRLDLDAIVFARRGPTVWRLTADGVFDAPEGAAVLAAQVDVDGAAARLDLALETSMRAAAPDAAPAALRLSARREGDGPVAVDMRSAPTPGVGLVLDGVVARDGTWRADGRLDAAAPSPATGAATLSLEGDLRAAAAAVDVAPDFAFGPLTAAAGARVALDASAAGATLSARAPRITRNDWRIDGVEIAAALSVDSALDPGPWDLAVDASLAAVEHRAHRWLARPVDLHGRVAPRGDGFALDVKAGDRGGVVPFVFSGGGGYADLLGDLRIGPIDLGAPGAAGALRRLAPELPPDLSLESGRIVFNGRIGLRDGAPRGDGRLSVDGLSATYDLISLRGLSGVVAFDSLAPPLSRTPTRLTIEALDVGLALRDGVVDFTIVDHAGAPELRVGGARWSAAGGVVRSGGFAIGPKAGPRRLLLDIDDVAIEALLLAADIPNLDGAGRLAGRMPIVIDPDGGMRIENARLTSADGRIAYAPPGLAESLGGADPQTPQGYLLALEDFRYDQMLARADGGLDDGLTFGFTLAGRNPAVAGGAPIQLEITVEGLKPLPLLRGFSAARAAADAAAKAARSRTHE